MGLSYQDVYRSGSYSQDMPSIHPYRLDCGIRAADGLDNSFQSYNHGVPRNELPSPVGVKSGKLVTFDPI